MMVGMPVQFSVVSKRMSNEHASADGAGDEAVDGGCDHGGGGDASAVHDGMHDGAGGDASAVHDEMHGGAGGDTSAVHDGAGGAMTVPKMHGEVAGG